MGRIDNLKSNELSAIVGRVRRVETTNPLDSGSVDNGRTTFRGLLSLVVQGSALVSGLLTVAGQLAVSGTQTLSGILTATGTTNLNGPVDIAGTQTVTGVLNGPWNLAGTGGITGDVASTGAWTQSGTMTLTGAGKVSSSSVSMDAAGLTSPLILNLNTPTVLVSDDIAINGDLTANGTTQLGGVVKVTDLPIASGTVFMVVADASGKLFRKAVAV
jgi:hypothetical protein